MPKAKINSVSEAFRTLSSGLRTAATRPNIYGYKPHAKQVTFHSSEAQGRLFLGGNRSGKSVGGAVEAIWWVTGKHPYMVTPPPPVRGRVVSVDFINGVEKIVKPEIARWLPTSELVGGSWETAYNKELRTLTLNNGSSIEFMSYDQVLEKFAGTSRHFIWFDEEPPHDIFTECKMRLIDTGGRWWITMTPVEGMCVDEETQLLSKRGWLYYWQVEPDDVVLTYNQKTKHTEWLIIESMYVNPRYSGLMTEFVQGDRAGNISALVTPDHKWVVRDKGLVPTNELKQHNRVIINAECASDPYPIYEDDFVALIGWVLTDGSVVKDHPQIRIYQSYLVNADKCQEIERILESLGAVWNKWDNQDKTSWSYTVYGQVAWEVRNTLGYPKDLSFEFVNDLSAGQRDILLSALVAGDGRYLPSGAWEFTTVVPEIADVVSALGVLCGYRTTIRESNLYKGIKVTGRTKTGRYNYNQLAVSELILDYSHYEGTVWCPHTKNGTFVARRNGSIYITSNTWVFDDIYMAARSDYNLQVTEVDMTENVYLNAGEIESFMSGLSADEKQARVRGKFVQIGGLIYKAFSEQHIIEPVQPPVDWLHVASMDAGFNNPTAWLWGAIDRDGRLIIYDEHYESGQVVSYHAERVKEQNRVHGREPDYYVGDPSIRNTDPITGTSVLLEYVESGIPIVLGNNDVRAGINRVAQMLEGYNGVPRLYITRNCVNLIYEIQRYRWGRWATKRAEFEKNKKEEPHKKADHACDSLRYLVASRPQVEDNTTVPRNLGSMGYPEAVSAFNRVDTGVNSPPKEYIDSFLGGEW